jgi:preprotein translocase subunit SecG
LDALYYIILILFVLVCLMLVGIILMQSSKSGGMGSAMTGNALNTAFGGEAADKLLVKITGVLAGLFMILAISLNVLSTPGSVNSGASPSDSILDRNKLDTVAPIINVPIGSEVKESEKDSL